MQHVSSVIQIPWDCVPTYCGELVAVEEVKYFPIESDVDPQVEVLPVPQPAELVARDPLSFN